jgi:hypothetical protein
MKQRKISIATLMLLGVLPLTALADTMPKQATPAPAAAKAADQSAQAQVPDMFKQLDKDHDGYINKSEAASSATVNANFAKLDTNRDSRISVDEYVTGTKG